MKICQTLCVIAGILNISEGAKHKARDDAESAVKSKVMCPPVLVETGRVEVTLTRFFGSQPPLVEARVVCASESRLSDSLLDTSGLIACPKANSVDPLRAATERMCIPDAVYDVFVRDHVRGPLILVDHASGAMRRASVKGDLRSLPRTEDAKYLALSPALYDGAVIVNEQLGSFFTRMHTAQALPVRPRVAIAPLHSEYVRASSTAVSEYITIRQLDGLRVGFSRPISPTELAARTSPEGSSVEFHGIDHEGECCFCDSARVCDEDSLVRLHCFHEYHTRCISKWVLDELKLTCPECRSPI